MSSKQDVHDRLQAAYSDINDIDAWVGGLAENHVYVRARNEYFRPLVRPGGLGWCLAAYHTE